MLVAQLPRRIVAWAAAALLLALAATACQAGGGESRIVHTEGHGPLSAGIPDGGYGLDAPGHVPWYGTFGSFVLCSTQGGTITIDDVRYVVKIVPLSVTPVMRSVPGGQGSQLRAPVLARRGQPGHFESVPHGLAGHLTDNVAGTKISAPCDQPVQAPYTELLTVMKLGSKGGWVRESDIDYTYGGEHYRLKVPYDLLGCGTAIKSDQYC